MGKQGLCLSCLHWHGGWEEAGRGKCTRTPTPGRVVLMGLGWAAGGCRGCWGSRPGAPEPAVGTEGSIISPSLESSSPPRRPPWEAEATLRGATTAPLYQAVLRAITCTVLCNPLHERQAGTIIFVLHSKQNELGNRSCS